MPSRRKPNKAYQCKYLKPAVKHSSERIRIWACFTVTGPGHIVVDRELLCIEKYSRVKYEAICLSAKAWPKVDHAT